MWGCWNFFGGNYQWLSCGSEAVKPAIAVTASIGMECNQTQNFVSNATTVRTTDTVISFAHRAVWHGHSEARNPTALFDYAVVPDYAMTLFLQDRILIRTGLA